MKTFMALYMGSASPDAFAAFEADPDREQRVARGMEAWGRWMTDNAAAVVEGGGPLGKTKRISPKGVSDVTNQVSGYVVVRAASHEAAAKMFEGHPSFAIFPGESVEVMEVLPIPGG